MKQVVLELSLIEAGEHIVEDVEVSLARTLRDDTRLLENVLCDASCGTNQNTS